MLSRETAQDTDAFKKCLGILYAPDPREFVYGERRMAV